MKRIFILILLLPSLLINAQVEITGTIISSEDNKPLPGVNVLIKESKIGTVSDLDGVFSIDVSDSSTVLIFSYVGFNNEEIKVGNQKIINVNLVPNLESLREVVVIGYGTQRKADLTSSIATLDPKELVKMPGGITDGLQGTVAGVNVSRGYIRIRGTSTTGDSKPLWVVDGLIGGTAPNENDIESIQILKDAASCAIYGSRGANGVIIVTTKQGKQDKPKIEYNSYFGTHYPWKTLDMMGAVDFSEYVNELYTNYNQQYPGSPQEVPTAYADPYNPLAETDWQDEWFRQGLYQDHNLSVSGGSKSLTYRTGLHFNEVKSSTNCSKSKNIGVFLNSKFKKGRVTIGQTLNVYNYVKSYGGGGYFDLLRSPSNLPVYNSEEEYGYYITGTSETGNDMINQIGLQNLLDRKEGNLNVKSTVYAEIQLIKGLNYKFNVGIDVYRGDSYSYDPIYDLGKGMNETADLKEVYRKTNRYMLEHTLNYEKVIGDHSISALYGITTESSNYREFSAKGSEFPSTNIQVLSAAQSEYAISGLEREYAQYSHLGRVQYSFLSRYLITSNFRIDGTSRFSESNRYAPFYSTSVGWKISEEAFMSSIQWIDNLKVRLSYGSIGNQVAREYGYESYVEVGNQFYTLGLDQHDAFAPIPKKFGNPGMKWETSYVFDAGFDLDMFNKKLSVIADFYNKYTQDLLIETPIPASSGSTVYPTLNAGEVLNRGVELSVINRNRIGEFFYSIGANISYNHNEWLKLGDNDAPFQSGDLETYFVSKNEVGSSIGRFYVLETDGVFKNIDEVNAHTYTDEDNVTSLIQPSAAPGDIRFVDRHQDGKIDEDDYYYAGSPIPIISYGLNVNCGYKNFDFAMLWQGDYGNKIYNNGISLIAHGTSAVNQSSSLVDRFRENDLTMTTVDGVTITLPANPGSDIPRAVYGDPNGNFTKPSDIFIEDGSYLRLKRLTLGYKLPEKLLNSIKVEGCRIYVGAKNLITITKYSLYDPEVVGLEEQGGHELTRGIDMQKSWASGNITSREYFAGIELTF